MNVRDNETENAPRVAIVTGAAGGIGQGIASHLVRCGYSVGLTDIDPVAVRSVTDDIAREAAGSVVGIAADLADPDSVSSAIATLAEKLGGYDVLVNCAGILQDARVPNMDPAVFRRVLAINLAGMLQTSSVSLPYLKASGSGRIISLTSRAWLGNFGSSNYSASKGGIAGVSRSFALSLAKSNVTVNCIAPGFIETPMSNSMPDEIVERVRQSIPVGRVGQPEDVARAVAFLADESAGYITGQTISVCGGRSISGSMRKSA